MSTKLTVEQVTGQDEKAGITFKALYACYERANRRWGRMQYDCFVNGEIRGSELSFDIALKAVAYNSAGQVLGYSQENYSAEIFDALDVFSIRFDILEQPAKIVLMVLKS